MHRSFRLPFAMLRRKGLLFFVVAILLIASISLVTMFVQTERIPSVIQEELEERGRQGQAKLMNRGKNERDIMQRILYLEEEIARNRESQSILKEHVELLRTNRTNPAVYELLLESLAERDREATADEKITQDAPYSKQELAMMSKCPRSYATNAQSDVNMAHLYDEMTFDNPDGGSWKQGWPIEENARAWNESYKLYVHIVPHSHQDPGWVKTIDEYFSGQVQRILDATFSTLSANADRRFIYAEMCFLDAYLAQASDEKRAQVNKALERKQLEFVTGGWVMTDEASAHVYAMLDQLVEGHEFLNTTFGATMRVRPSSSWSIDPFGYSSTMPYLLAKAGIRDLLIQRVHYAFKKQFARSRQLEFRWRQPFDAAGRHEVFTHVMPFYSYDIPHTCGPDPAVCCQFDFVRQAGDRLSCPWHAPAKAITAQNVAERASMLLSQYRKHASLFRTNQLLVLLGDDFRYETLAEFSRQHDNYGLLFKHLNADSSAHVHIKWSTLGEYFGAVRYAAPPLNDHLMPALLPTLVGDFHTYADRDDHYWSGYFTSRPFQKWLSRQLEFHLRTAEQLVAFASVANARADTSAPYAINVPEMLRKLRLVRRALGIFQHHDSITGTSKDHVVADNGKRLLAAISIAKQLINTASASLLLRADAETQSKKALEIGDKQLDGDKVFKLDEMYSDPGFPPTPVIVNVDGAAHVMLYNSLTIRRAALHRLRVSTPFVGVLSVAEGRFVEAQVEPIWNHEYSILNNAYQLTFRIDIPPLSFSKYRLVQFDDEASMRARSHTQLVQLTLHNLRARYPEVLSDDDDAAFVAKRLSPFAARLVSSLEYIEMQSDRVKLRVSSHSGMLSGVSLDGGSEMRAEFSYVTYATRSGRERSGAYLFLPDGPAKQHTVEQPLIRVHHGPLTDELHVALQYVNSTLRFVKARGVLSSDFIELTNLVDIRSSFNTELGFRMQTDMLTGTDDDHSQFHTDQNCFQMARRKTQMPKVPLQGNVYPFACAAFIEGADGRTRMTLLSQQSLAVSSLKRGSLEVMLDRRLNQDDGRGLEQGVMDNRLTPSTFRFHFSVENEKVRADNPTLADSESDQPSNKQLDLLSHWNMLDLNNPVFLFVPKSDASPSDKLDDPRTDYSSFPKRLTLAQADAVFPCDTHLVNIRASLEADNEALSTAVFLHRFGIDCDWLPDTLRSMRKFCSTTGDGHFSLHQLLDRNSQRQVKRVSRTSLNLLDELKQESTQNVAVDAYEIDAFKMAF